VPCETRYACDSSVRKKLFGMPRKLSALRSIHLTRVS
jgi:hypothetical protein